MHLRGDSIVVHDLQSEGVIGIVEDVVLDTTVHATGDFDITADSIGGNPLVHGTADALGTIDHEIDAHDMDWLIRVSSLRVNASDQRDQRRPSECLHRQRRGPGLYRPARERHLRLR